MYEQQQIVFIYTETPLHVGAGKSVGYVDLPIQRDRTTGYPIVQGSSFKGAMRSAYRTQHGVADTDPQLAEIFGKTGLKQDNTAGAVSFGDANLLLFPVRSLKGVFAWCTSVHALAQFERTARLGGMALPWQLPTAPATDTVLLGKHATTLSAQGTVVLEEFSYTIDQSQKTAVDAISAWLATHAFATAGHYWQTALQKQLCILPDDAFRSFAQFATQVQTHIKLDPDTKTGINGALWTQENLPVDTLLYAPLLVRGARRALASSVGQTAQEIADKLAVKRLQMGGAETTGHGWVNLSMYSDQATTEDA